jgi:hypothetical protein
MDFVHRPVEDGQKSKNPVIRNTIFRETLQILNLNYMWKYKPQWRDHITQMEIGRIAK